MAKILILGGSNCQINAILKSKKKGHSVIVSDYYEDAPGKAYSDNNELTSTFDVKGNMEVADKYGIDGIITLGTDQPVLTAAMVAHEFSLPAMIDVDTAKAVTNKKVMKNMFKSHSIPTVNFKMLAEDFSDDELADIKFPVVIKPLDSQGQRGVYKLDTISDIRRLFQDVLSYSQEKELLLEEYYESDEITLSGWVRNDTAHVLTVTDRITYNNYPHIGVCTAHFFPSRYLGTRLDEIETITNQIVKSFGIHNGPIYFQMLLGSEGIKVNEIACRIGGAYEDELIPLLTGVDVLDMLIDSSLGIDVDFSSLDSYNLRSNKKAASVQMIFAKPGLIKSLADMAKIRKLPGVKYGKFNFKPGCRVKDINNATQRVGYLIIDGKNTDEMYRNIERAFNSLEILDEHGSNILMNLWHR